MARKTPKGNNTPKKGKKTANQKKKTKGRVNLEGLSDESLKELLNWIEAN